MGQTDSAHRFAQSGRIFKRDDAADAERQPEADEASRLFGVAGEAVDDAPDRVPALRFEDLDKVGERVAQVENRGEAAKR